MRFFMKFFSPIEAGWSLGCTAIRSEGIYHAKSRTPALLPLLTFAQPGGERPGFVSIRVGTRGERRIEEQLGRQIVRGQLAAQAGIRGARLAQALLRLGGRGRWRLAAHAHAAEDCVLCELRDACQPLRHGSRQHADFAGRAQDGNALALACAQACRTLPVLLPGTGEIDKTELRAWRQVK